MSGRCLLDTNVVIALFAGDTSVTDQLQDAAEVFIPSIAIGELHYGAQKSGRVAENTTQIDEFVAVNVILNCDSETGRHYGQIKNRLREMGRPIPENDIWIAALTVQHELTLVLLPRFFC